MIDLDNPELQNALQIIQFTRRSLFLTGKAGTGKSTFLRYIAANTKKKHIILAPTGIAAINAGRLLQCVKRCEHLAHWVCVATTRRIAALKVRIAVPSPETC